MNDDPLSPEVRQRLAELRHRPQSFPQGLEDRTVERLAHEGVFRSRRPFGMGWLAIAGMAAVLFVAGFSAGRILAKPPSSEVNYVLLLQESHDYRPAAQGPETMRRVDEYREWASTLRSQGVEISGLKLQDRSAALGKIDTGSSGELAGLFLVRARDMQQVRRIAETCPHLRYGGGIVIRPVEKT